MLKNIKNNIRQFFNNIKQIKIDKDVRKKYLEDIKYEIQNPESLYNKYGLTSNNDYTTISCFVNIPEEYQLSTPDIIKYTKLQENVTHIMKYIINLGYGNYFTAPEFFYIEEVDDTQKEENVLTEVSCTYIASWDYKPMLDMYPNFKWQFPLFIGASACILASLITGLIILL